MGFKKIGDVKTSAVCRDPSHDPPMHIALPAGVWEWECPACGRKQIVIVASPIYQNYSWTLDGPAPKAYLKGHLSEHIQG